MHIALRMDRKGVLILVLSVALVVLAAVDMVLLVHLGQRMMFYAFAVNQTVYPFAFVPICWVFVWSKQYCASRRRRLLVQHNHDYDVDAHELALIVGAEPQRRNLEDWETEDPAMLVEDTHSFGANAGLYGANLSLSDMLPKFATIAALDGCAMLLSFLPMLNLDSEMQVVLSQIGLPATLFFSFVYLDRRYKATHYIAVLIVITGVCVALVPSLDISEADMVRLALWVILALAATIPSSFSKVFQERWLGDYDLHPIYLLAWTSLFQLVLSVVLLAVPLIPFPVPAPHVTPDRFFTLLSDSFACFLGDASVTTRINATYGADSAIAAALNGAECGGVPPYVIFAAFLAVNITYNAVFVSLIKVATANITSVTSVLRIGFAALLFTCPFIAGPAQRSLDRHTVLALIVVILGVATFHSQPERRKRPRNTFGTHIDDHEQEYHDTTLETPDISPRSLDVNAHTSLSSSDS